MERTNTRKPNNDNKKKYFFAPISISNDATDDTYNEILDVLADLKFNKVSFQLYATRSLVDKLYDVDDIKLTTVGFIKSYRSDKRSFSLTIFDAFKEAIEKFEDPVVNIMYTEYNGKLGCVTKFIISPSK